MKVFALLCGVNAACVLIALFTHFWGVPMFIAGVFNGVIAGTLLSREPPSDLRSGRV